MKPNFTTLWTSSPISPQSSFTSHSSQLSIPSHSLSSGDSSLHPSFAAGIDPETASISDHQHLLQGTYATATLMPQALTPLPQLLDYHPNTLPTSQHAYYTSSSAFRTWKQGIVVGSIRSNASEGQQLLKRCLFHLVPCMIPAPSTTMSLPPAQDGEAYMHMMAERNRRRRQNECFKKLKSLLPGSIKRDKVSILEGAINYTAYLSARVQELEKQRNELDNILEAKNSLPSVKKAVRSTDGSWPLPNYVKVTEDDYPEGSIFRVDIRTQLNHLNFHSALFKALAYLNEMHLQVLWSQAESDCSTSCSIILLTLKEGMSVTVNCDDIQTAIENLISCEDDSVTSDCSVG